MKQKPRKKKRIIECANNGGVRWRRCAVVLLGIVGYTASPCYRAGRTELKRECGMCCLVVRKTPRNLPIREPHWLAGTIKRIGICVLPCALVLSWNCEHHCGEGKIRKRIWSRKKGRIGGGGRRWHGVPENGARRKKEGLVTMRALPAGSEWRTYLFELLCDQCKGFVDSTSGTGHRNDSLRTGSIWYVDFRAGLGKRVKEGEIV